MECKVIWNLKAKKELLGAPNKITYAVAAQTLDLSFIHIPLSKRKGRGKLRQTSKSAGVRGTDGNYYIGSYTSYASRVWKMPSSTNWSEPGTNNKWYERTWKKYGKSIQQNVVERYKLK